MGTVLPKDLETSFQFVLTRKGHTGAKGTNTQFRQTKYQDTNQETDIIVVVVVLEKIIKTKLN